MNTTQQFLQNIFGTIEPVTYLSAFAFIFMGLIIKWAFQINSGVKKNSDTPNTFSWAYWFQNNFFKAVLSFVTTPIVAFVALRFSTEIFNISLSMFFAFCVGIGFDFVLDYVKKLQNKLEIPK